MGRKKKTKKYVYKVCYICKERKRIRYFFGSNEYCMECGRERPLDIKRINKEKKLMKLVQDFSKSKKPVRGHF